MASADGFKSAVESGYQVLSGLLEILDGAQLEAKPTGEAQPLLTVEEAAAYLRVTERTIRTWIVSGDIPHRKAQGEIRFDRRELERWTIPGKNSIAKSGMRVIK